MVPPTTKKELQRLFGKINFVRRFISNLSRRIEPFMCLVKIKDDNEFYWGAEQQKAFDNIKEYLSTPPSTGATSAREAILCVSVCW